MPRWHHPGHAEQARRRRLRIRWGVIGVSVSLAIAAVAFRALELPGLETVVPGCVIRLTEGRWTDGGRFLPAVRTLDLMVVDIGGREITLPWERGLREGDVIRVKIGRGRLTGWSYGIGVMGLFGRGEDCQAWRR